MMDLRTVEAVPMTTRTVERLDARGGRLGFAAVAAALVALMLVSIVGSFATDRSAARFDAAYCSARRIRRPLPESRRKSRSSGSTDWSRARSRWPRIVRRDAQVRRGARGRATALGTSHGSAARRQVGREHAGYVQRGDDPVRGGGPARVRRRPSTRSTARPSIRSSVRCRPRSTPRPRAISRRR